MTKYHLKIEKTVYGADGLARSEDGVIFVKKTLPNEHVEAEIFSKKKSHQFAKALKIEKSSPHRIKPSCEHYDHCGGCHYLHCDYDYQRRLKSLQLQETLEKIAKIFPKNIQILSLDEHLKYRQKITLRQDLHDKGLFGFYQLDNQKLLAPLNCQIAHENIAQLLPKVYAWIEQNQESAAAFQSLLLSTDHQKTSVFFVNNIGFKKEVAQLSFDQNTPLFQKMTLLKEVVDETVLTFEYADHTILYSPFGFFQNNDEGLRDILYFVRQTIPEDVTTLWDLYAGTGVFGICLADFFDKIYCVESNPISTYLLTQNILLNKQKKVVALNSKVDAQLKFLSSQVNLKKTLAFIDPPRTGLDKRTRSFFTSKSAPKHLYYLSCNPATLARDLKEICTRYTLSQIILIDLFPQTYHFEVLAILERN